MRLPSDLLVQVREQATAEGLTLTAYVQRCLEAILGGAYVQRTPVRTDTGNGVRTPPPESESVRTEEPPVRTPADPVRTGEPVPVKRRRSRKTTGTHRCPVHGLVHPVEARGKTWCPECTPGRPIAAEGDLPL
jgi:hypothetical protein